jgi:small-conductance mechanosensitive channel
MFVDHSETLIGIAEIAVALAGFTGVVVAVRSREHGGWHPGDQLRLVFLLEASLSAAGFALLTLVLFHALPHSASTVWTVASMLWAVFMPWSLYTSHRRIKDNQEKHGDIDKFANRFVFVIFFALIILQLINVFFWREFAPLLAALCFNLAGAAMQFSRLVRSAFHN